MTQSGGLTTFIVKLATDWVFVNTGASGSGGSLNFGFGSPLAALSIINTSSNGWNHYRRAIPGTRRHPQQW